MMNRSVSSPVRLRVVAASLIALGVVAGASYQVTAQFPMLGVRGYSSASLITPPRSVRQIISDAERAIAEERWSEAVVRLGDFLQQDAADAVDPAEAQDYFLDADRQRPNTTLDESLYRTARRMIGALPARARETYELQYGPNAKRMLQEATEQRDWHLLGDVRRKYFHTQAGYQASVLLARHAWQNGRSLQCALLLEDVVEVSGNSEAIDSSTRLLYAMACLAGGHALAPEFAVQGPLPAIGGGPPIGADETLRGSDLENWITDQITIGSIAKARRQSDFALLGARADRNGGASGQMPLSRPEWMVEMTASPREADLLTQQAARLKDAGELMPPTSQPLRIDDQVLVRTTQWLVGIDYQTGKMVWTFPWFSAHENLDEFDGVIGVTSEEQEAYELVGRVYNDLPYGQITSDGERLFLLEGLDAFESFAINRSRIGLRSRGQSANTLVALELQTQGKLLWRVGADEEDASALGDAFFLGPPLPIDGRLYVMAEVSGDLGLFCLDPATGAEIWRQTLGSLEGLQIRSDPVRRMAGAMPTYHEGLLLCPTGNGLVVAVNLVDRSLRWARVYPRDSLSRNESQNSRNYQDQLLKRWADGMAIAADNHVVVTPIESDRLMVLNASTGRPRFSEQPRSRSIYVAGIRDERFILVGHRYVSAMSIEDGTVVWKTGDGVFTGDQQVCGRGVFGDGDYLLPTSTNELIRISLEDGSVLERKTVGFPLGNLVAAGGDFFSQTATKVTLASGINSLRPVVEERLQADPDNVAAMVDQSKLLLEAERRGEAVEVLKRAEVLAPDNDEVHDLLVSAMLEELRSADSLSDTLIESLESRIDQPEQRTRFLFLQISAYLRAGRSVEAIEKLIDLAELRMAEATTSPAELMIQEDRHEVRVNDWIAARVHEAMQTAERADAARLDQIVRDRLSNQLGRSTKQLQELLTQFAATTFGDQIRRQIFGRLKTTRSYHEIERLALGRQTRQDWDKLSDDRLFMLAYAYAKGDMPEDAGKVLGELGGREVIDSLQQQTWAGKLPESSGMPGPVLDLWPRGVKVDVSSIGLKNPSIIDGGRITIRSRFAGLRNLSNASEQFRGWEFGTNSSQSLLLRDSLGRTRVIGLRPAVQPRNGMRESKISGGMVVLAIGNELIALDMIKLEEGTQSPLLWRRDITVGQSGVSVLPKDNQFKDSVYRNRISNGELINGALPEISLGPVLGDRLFLLQNGELLCLDARTGQLRWRQSDAPRTGVVVFGDDQVAVVSPDTKSLHRFDAFDGQKLQTRPWTDGTVWGTGPRYVLAIASSQIDPPRDADATGGGENQSSETGEWSVRLIDPFTDAQEAEAQDAEAQEAEARQPVLQLSMPGARRRSDQTDSAFGRLLDGRWMVLLRNNGELVIWDIVQGLELTSTTLPPLETLNGVSVAHLRGKLIVFPQVRQAPVVNRNGPKTIRRTTDDQEETIAAYAFDTEGGQELWQQIFADPWGVTIDQAASTPFLLFTRVHSDYGGTGPRRQRLDYLAIDVRDGKTLANVLGQSVESQFNLSDTELTLKPYDSVKAEVGTQVLTFDFFRDRPDAPESDDDEAIPDAP